MSISAIMGLTGVGGGNMKYQEFTSSGTWNKPNNNIEVAFALLVAGGGSGAAYSGNACGGAGGEVIFGMAFVKDNSSYTVTIGAGGAGVSNAQNGNVGGNTTFANLTAYASIYYASYITGTDGNGPRGGGRPFASPDGDADGNKHTTGGYLTYNGNYYAEPGRVAGSPFLMSYGGGQGGFVNSNTGSYGGGSFFGSPGIGLNARAGGGASWGNGTNGSSLSDGSSSSAAANSGAGSGAGGSAGSGNGGSGYAIIFWNE